jgi:hypothetical protein
MKSVGVELCRGLGTQISTPEGKSNVVGMIPIPLCQLDELSREIYDFEINIRRL